MAYPVDSFLQINNRFLPLYLSPKFKIMQTQIIPLNVEDGSFMDAYTSVPDGDGPFPGIIIFQEAYGVNAHIRDVADRFAREGYAAIAPELFQRSAEPGFEGNYTDFATVAPHMQKITVDGLSFDIESAYEWLIENPKVNPDKIAVIGFCMGGRVAFLANALVPIQASVSFYGGGIPALLPQFAHDIHAPQLFMWGGDDSHIPAEQIKQVTDAMDETMKPYVSKVFPGVGHAFFCDARASYNPEAAREAWKISLDFLKEKLG